MSEMDTLKKWDTIIDIQYLELSTQRADMTDTFN